MEGQVPSRKSECGAEIDRSHIRTEKRIKGPTTILGRDNVRLRKAQALRQIADERTDKEATKSWGRCR